jgi:hypothetical protein
MVVIGAPEAIEIAGKIIRAMNPGMAMNYGGGGMPGMAPGSFGGGSAGYSTPFPQPNRFGGSSGGAGGGAGQLMPVPQPGHPPESADPGAPAPKPGGAVPR